MSSEEDLRRINDIIAARFCKIEDRIASAETIAELFENLFDGIEKEFEVPFVWLTLTNAAKAAPVITGVRSSDVLKSRLSVVSQELVETLIPGGLKPVLVNHDLQPFYKLLPPSRKYFVRSLAAVPIALDGCLIGVWNNGDADVYRYAPDMKTDLIESLAGRVSSRLTRLVAQIQPASDQGCSSEIPRGPHD
jgi:uncharacterized protein YigA (DUF484 family)